MVARVDGNPLHLIGPFGNPLLVSKHLDPIVRYRQIHKMLSLHNDYAVEHEWLPRNPLVKLKSSAIAASRDHYVSREQTELVRHVISKYFKYEPAKAIQWKVSLD